MSEPVATRFVDRHIGPRPAEISKMLAEIGSAGLEDLISETVPARIRTTSPLDLPNALSEPEAIERLREFADKNTVLTSLIGQGYYGTITPPVIQRNILENPAWYTAYTPYQAEISQGRLEALLNFQTMVSDLTGLEVANASLLDEATAAAEAMAMTNRIHRGKRPKFFVDERTHPQTISVMATRAQPIGIEMIVGPIGEMEPSDVSGCLIQYPDTTGAIPDLRSVCNRATDAGALVVVATDLFALTMLESPGRLGASIAVGSAQRFGVPMGFGGPHAAFIATTEDHVRALPGRLVGVSTDPSGRPAYRLALQTREQHIRRDKATSNVCTAQALLAVIASMYACWHGPDGLLAIAERVHDLTGRLAASLRAAGIGVENDTYFDTLTVEVTGMAEQYADRAEAAGLNLRRVDQDRLGVSLDELTDVATLARLLEVFEAELVDEGGDGIPEHLVRQTTYLTHPIFTAHRSETQMLRYLRTLADKDLALDRTMIPLGSCTMKLNSTTSMIPITWPEFSSIHPYAPEHQATGYLEMIGELEAWLSEITGYDAVSLQPNAGSQGEFAGLLAIRAYHRSRGEGDRDICLIPSSAHGTNAASAVMAGMTVKVVACDDHGNVDLDDLNAKLAEFSTRVSALMVTYPSTHGVFEEAITDICDAVHAVGGQVYVDGANLNALVGVAKPGAFGADVSHLNLHKTFTIPHGGGGPGVGPIGVRAHLAPFLPGDPLADDSPVGPVSAARYGSAGILPIPWAYIAMMGADGLTAATQVAVLEANHVASRLGPHYPILYTGAGGRVAHECIIDIREITHDTGISAEDIAKRLADHVFHAPTLSFPVAGTLMIEPTESEPLVELERFCEAMISIRKEIARVESGEWPADDNPLVNAPHTAAMLLNDDWNHPYPPSVGAFPTEDLETKDYFPPVGRVDGAAGDRHLICTCPPITEFED
ncbi:MAG: aminomethyl-transferring glycine dehydrogenase [Acidimicrobiia bacterium]|nr:aminomethyl-transferring glycine dehydrogenase [Acidimicrobiia bacterium]